MNTTKDIRVKLDITLATVMRETWGDSAVEALVGSLSSLCSDSQLIALINHNLTGGRVLRITDSGELFLGDGE